MEVVKEPGSCQLEIKIQTGVNALGKPVYKVRRYKNVKTGAPDSDVYTVGQGLAALQKHPVIAVSRLDEGGLKNKNN